MSTNNPHAGFTREQAMERARKALWRHTGNTAPYEASIADELQAVYAMALEDAAVLCDSAYPHLASAIRRLTEQPK